MAKKCIICDKEAEYCIKDSSECYCKECAIDNFGDLSYLVTVEEEAKRLKAVVDAQIEETKLD